MKMLVLIISTLSLPALAGPIGYAERERYVSGAATIEPAAGGEYVYAAPTFDSRTRTRAVLIGSAQRQSYALFSAEEEEALLHYRDQQLASQLKERVVVARVRHYRATGLIDWPKVVVRAQEICVPALASSEALDWREHQVCHRDRGVR
jgi:hypothetical protein